MRLILATLFVVIACHCAAAEDKFDWKDFAPKDAGFKVSMPGVPKQNEVETESDFGKGTLHINDVQVAKTIFAANYSHFPAEIKKAPLKQVLDSSRDGAVADLDGKLVSDKEIKLGKHTGREIQVEINGGKLLFRARIYLVEQHLYQVVVFGTKERATSKNADKFLDSFELTEK